MDISSSLTGLSIGSGLAAIGVLSWTLWRRRREFRERRHTGQQLKDLHLLLEHAAEGILRLDLNGRFVTAHSQWARRLGWRAEEIVGRHWRELLRPEDAAKMHKALTEAADDPLELEVRVWRRDGRETYQRLTIFAARDENGRLSGYEWLCKDITQSKRDDEKLRLQTALLQAVSEASVEGILVLSGDRRLIAFNQRLREMFALDEKCLRIGAPAEQLLCHIFQQANDSVAMEAIFSRMDAEHHADAGEFSLTDGRVLQQLTAPLESEGLPMGGRAWFFRDITDKRRVTEELLQARDRADAANRAKSTFLANISHEIRTPMTAVLGYAELMIARCETRDAELLQWAQTIHRGGSRLVLLMNEILELSKIEAGRLTIEPGECSIAEIVEDAIDLFRPQAREQALAVAVQYAQSVPEKLYTDANRLRQILANLIGNAIKFTPAGGVRLAVSGAGSQLCIDVIDSGVGMTADEQAQLFEPFAQARGPHGPRRPGVGLGLAISRRLARLLGGDIICQSEAGAGSRFTLLIENRLAMETTPSPRSDIACGPGPRIDGAKILIADDVPMVREYLSTLLSQAGAEIVAVEDGLTALQSARQAASRGTAFDVILMDMQMPVMDGYAAITNLRQSGYSGAILALSASAMEQDRQRCLAVGCDDFESKPLNRAVLLAKIARYAERRPNRDAA